MTLNVGLMPIFSLARTNCLSEGEFHVDLYTLPDNLVKMLWEFVVKQQAA